MKAHLILGNQLLKNHPALDSPKSEPVIMIESIPAFKRYPYHKQKILFILTSMRSYADFLKSQGREVIYIKLTNNSISEELANLIKERSISQISLMKPADRAPRNKLIDLFNSLGLKLELFDNQLHITNEEDFKHWYESKKSPKMEDFYRQQRQKLNILMDQDKPIGGLWNYDKENRKPLPKNFNDIPKMPTIKSDAIQENAKKDVLKHYSNHPGELNDLWLPTNHEKSEELLEEFIKYKLTNFGKYEDAFKKGEPLLFHSGISALLNIGLLEVNRVIERVVSELNEDNLASIEGFVRQIIGWREYIYGLYWNEAKLIEMNYFGFKKNLEDYWFNLEIKDNLPEVIKNSLRTLDKFAYNHHIERLMVLGNWFLLNEYNPKSVNDWFMSMYIDSSEWVMLPNVIGMSQYGDGGIIATKPYISGDNYLNKMGDIKSSEYTELYWHFLNKHRDKLITNPRMNLVLSLAHKKT